MYISLIKRNIQYSAKVVKNIIYNYTMTNVSILMGKLGYYDKLKIGQMDKMTLRKLDERV